MLETLLYASLNCEDAIAIIKRIESNDKLSDIVKTELVVTLKESSPHCDWDANG